MQAATPQGQSPARLILTLQRREEAGQHLLQLVLIVEILSVLGAAPLATKACLAPHTAALFVTTTSGKMGASCSRRWGGSCKDQQLEQEEEEEEEDLRLPLGWRMSDMEEVDDDDDDEKMEVAHKEHSPSEKMLGPAPKCPRRDEYGWLTPQGKNVRPWTFSSLGSNDTTGSGSTRNRSATQTPSRISATSLRSPGGTQPSLGEHEQHDDS